MKEKINLKNFIIDEKETKFIDLNKKINLFSD